MWLFSRPQRPPGSRLLSRLKRAYGKRATIRIEQLAPMVVNLVKSPEFIILGKEAALAIFEVFLVAQGDDVVRQFIAENKGWAIEAVELFAIAA